MSAVDDNQKKQQIIEVLENRYFSMIPTRLTNRSELEQRKDRLSRSLAALAIQKLSGCGETQAAASIVDCGDDNGIDAIFYDHSQNTLWLIQSKYGNAPTRADNLTFCNGIKDLLEERYERFRQSGQNPEFDRVQADVEDALQTADTKIVAGVVYLGNPLGPHAVGDLNQLMVEQNEIKEWFDWRDIDLQTIHGWLAEEHRTGSKEPVQITLFKWNGSTTAVYGLVKAAELEALHRNKGNALFTKNIRHFLGDQAVNLGIAQTVASSPDKLFLLNNGITAICANFTHAGSNKSRATFTMTDFSIVNGAQTVGSIGIARQRGEIATDAELLITIIAVGEGETANLLSTQITRTRNTQNRINRNDFTALDPNQERLRQELAISGIAYQYRPSSDSSVHHTNQFSLEDAARALACFNGDTQLAVAVKKEIGQVYDREGSYYSRLFRDDLSGARLFRFVQIYLYADELFANSENAGQGRRAAFFRHSRYFVLHIWARQNRAMLNKAEMMVSNDDKLQISREILEIAEQTYTIAEGMFAATDKGYLKIFRNLTDAEPLAQAVMRHLSEALE